jgi:hypothetical protein
VNDKLWSVVATAVSTLAVSLIGWAVRRIRNNIHAIRYANEDISTIWKHLKLSRRLRSGSYKYPRGLWDREDDE